MIEGGKIRKVLPLSTKILYQNISRKFHMNDNSVVKEEEEIA